jgi:hypothetical protein
MQRVQIQLTDAQLAVLRRRSQASGEGVAALVRRAVDDWMAAERRRAHVERALEAIGGFHSGLGDLAERHDDYLDETP